MSKQETYRKAKLNIIGSKNDIQLEVAKSYADLAKFYLDFNQWIDLLENYELKKRIFNN